MYNNSMSLLKVFQNAEKNKNVDVLKWSVLPHYSHLFKKNTHARLPKRYINLMSFLEVFQVWTPNMVHKRK